MDWVVIVVILGTGMFLVPIINDFQRRSLALSRKLSEVEALIQDVEAANERDREEERSVSAELKQAETELAEAEQEKGALRAAIDTKKKKR